MSGMSAVRTAAMSDKGAATISGGDCVRFFLIKDINFLCNFMRKPDFGLR